MKYNICLKQFDATLLKLDDFCVFVCGCVMAHGTRGPRLDIEKESSPPKQTLPRSFFSESTTRDHVSSATLPLEIMLAGRVPMCTKNTT